MESKQAADILMKMLNNHELNEEEKEAILKAIGILSWTMLTDSRMKAKKLKKSL